MSNSLTKTDLLNSMVRPKRLFVSSEDVANYDDSGRCKFTLRESIIAQEGFRLAYGLKSFGYSATANTISEKQKNNRLLLEITYLEPEYIYKSGAWIYDQTPGSIVRQMEYIIPDGYYATFSDLCQVLNNPLLNLIPSGLKINVMENEQLRVEFDFPGNEVPIQFIWVPTPYGYFIDCKLSDEHLIKNDYTNNGVKLQAKEVNYRPDKVRFLPGNVDSPHYKLYQLLFHNDTGTSSSALNMPNALGLRGINPPDAIVFEFQSTLSYDSAAIDPVDFIDPNENFHYKTYIESVDNMREFETEAQFDPLKNEGVISHFWGVGYQNTPFQVYFSPRLCPIYIQVNTNLETQNLTIDGYASNLLFRHFPLGSDQGAKSFYQSWDQPVMHHARSARNSIDHLDFHFEAESELWDFFNLTFNIEFIFYEIPDEEELPTYANEPIQVPTEDMMTSQLQKYSNRFHDPFPLRHTTEESGTLIIGSSRSGHLKKRRHL